MNRARWHAVALCAEASPALALSGVPFSPPWWEQPVPSPLLTSDFLTHV